MRSLTLELAAQSARCLARLPWRGCACGFALSIGDFGTGFSSLAQLVRRPFSELKIERCFVGRLVEDRAARTLVELIIGLARRLGLRTVAEGIETEAQLEILRQLDCDMGQGFLFSKPKPVDEWLRWMNVSSSSETSAVAASAQGGQGSG